MNIEYFEARVNIFINNIKYINEEAAEYIMKNKLKFFADDRDIFKICKSDSDVLVCLFCFADSPQGLTFWENVLYILKNRESMLKRIYHENR